MRTDNFHISREKISFRERVEKSSTHSRNRKSETNQNAQKSNPIKLEIKLQLKCKTMIP